MNTNSTTCSPAKRRPQTLLLVGLCLTGVGCALVAIAPWVGMVLLIVAIGALTASMVGRSGQASDSLG